ncbi:DUF4097 family beta strand repeat-containing protein [Streptomyces sp. NPDC006529]|uniref:DUF4097 family beta strand repeat-containing protein n=1 Tax=Streptomyces sp. NPDC006529 TaxID=3157177 RepID=UPI0033A1826A
MQKFSTPTPVTAVLDVPAGHIRFIAADRTDTTVEVLPANPSHAGDVKAADRITVAYAEGDGILRIEAAPAKNRALGSSGSVEVTVQLPAGSRIEAKAADAEFRGVGRLGDVVIETARGSVKLDESADSRLTLQAGDVTVGRLGGAAAISTQKGDLHITEAVRGAVELRTGYGNIAVGAARGVSASLDAETQHGRVHNALRNTEGATAPLHIRATTAYGDITAAGL